MRDARYTAASLPLPLGSGFAADFAGLLTDLRLLLLLLLLINQVLRGCL
jgi:hypothetical protein